MDLILTSARAKARQAAISMPARRHGDRIEAERKEIKKVVLRGALAVVVAAIKKARAHTDAAEPVRLERITGSDCQSSREHKKINEGKK